MKILLDTHILLWAISNSPLLDAKAREIILNPENEIYYSVISTWEVQLKHIAHPEAMSLDGERFSKYCKQSGFINLPLKETHIFALLKLSRKPEATPHKDPFDRLLICQASEENMLFITHDSLISDYNVPCIIKV